MLHSSKKPLKSRRPLKVGSGLERAGTSGLNYQQLSPSSQGRVKLSCGLSVERCAFKTAFNLPLTHNPQPVTQNLPFFVPSRSGQIELRVER